MNTAWQSRQGNKYVYAWFSLNAHTVKMPPRKITVMMCHYKKNEYQSQNIEWKKRQKEGGVRMKGEQRNVNNRYKQVQSYKTNEHYSNIKVAGKYSLKLVKLFLDGRK